MMYSRTEGQKRERFRGRAAASALALSLALLPSAVKAAAYEKTAGDMAVIEESAEEPASDIILIEDAEYIEEEEVPAAIISAALGSSEAAARAAELAFTAYEEKLSYASVGYFIWPVEGTITSGFGRRNISVGSNNHKGIDIANSLGTEVAAADAGEVIWSGWDNSYGNFIKIQHDNGLVTCYAHLSERLVEVGDRVRQGDIIGKIGTTGQSTGPHLHFEVRTEENERVNPIDYLPEKEG